MGKKRIKTAKRAEELKQAKLTRKRNRKIITVSVASAVLVLILIIAIVSGIERPIVFKYDKGAYIDPETQKTYCPADTSTYLIKTECYPDNFYGKMDGNNVYTIPGVKNKEWLVRQLSDDLYQLYYEESVHLPSISEFKANGLYLFVDAPLIFNRVEITEKAVLDNVVSLLTGGEKTELLEDFKESYSIRFFSDEYEHMYYCVEYIVVESGSYFYDHLSGSYIYANGLLDSYLDELRENSGE